MELPKLKIVKINSLLLHENFDPQRTERLIKKVPKDRVFINPVIVGRVPGNKKLVLLDGANRVEALKQLGVKDILVQIVNYFNPEEVELGYSRHYLKYTKTQQKQLLEKLQRVIKLSAIKLSVARKKAEQGKIIGYIYLKDLNKTFNFGNSRNILGSIGILNQVVDAYIGKTEVYRLTELQHPGQKLTVEIGFKKLLPRDVYKIAKSKLRIHSGITRHIVSATAIRLNIPFKMLKSKISLVQKNRWLDKFIQKKVNNKETRYYGRPIYIFDEWKKER